jgi:hypothetical protein
MGCYNGLNHKIQVEAYMFERIVGAFFARREALANKCAGNAEQRCQSLKEMLNFRMAKVPLKRGNYGM